ncbi:MAG: type II secretion system secretin GspD, partial [Deltaproteobacteria bacterium]|nr:type II secretion system secretin GspD [Deltaproteobacteria bacterium]
MVLSLTLSVLLAAGAAPAWAADEEVFEEEIYKEELAPKEELLPPEENGEEPPSRQPKTRPKPDSEPSSPVAGKGDVTLYFKDVDVRVLIQFIAKLTGKTYIVADKVAGRVSIVSPEPVTVEEAVRIFEAVLEVNGFTTITQGEVVKVIPVREARREGMPIIPSPERPPVGSESMFTQIITLRHSDASTLRGVLVPLAGRYAYITADRQTNSLIITDVASNVRRLASIVTILDKPGIKGLVEVVDLRHANASEIAEALGKLFQRPQVARPKQAPRPLGAEEPLKALADKRTNSLILLGTRAAIDKAREIIAQLDQPEPEGQFNIHVIHLKYAVAEELAEVLGNLSQDEPDQTKRSTASKTTLPAEQRNLRVLSKMVNIVAEPATNSLIVSATPQEFKVIEAIVAKLDIRRTMVYVEAVILEMSATKSLEFGISWHGAAEVEGGLIGGGVGRTLSGDPDIDFGPGINFGVLGQMILFGDLVIPTLSALLKAVQADTDIRIVATPQILTADNEEAIIRVAQNLPFVTRMDQGTATDERAIQIFDYRDVGYTLKVTPRVSAQDIVRLTIDVEAKSVVTTHTTDQAGNIILAPTTNVRQAKTVLLARNGDIVAIGGLIGQELESRGDQVPCLGSLPVAGWAFKSRRDTSRQTNLLIFLSPHVLDSEEAVKTLSEEKLDLGRESMPPP